MQDLINDMLMKQKQLDVAIKTLRNTGQAYAEAERDYKMLLREEVLKLRDKGIAVGVIEKICYGIPSVAEARFKRDVAKTVYEANQESINAIKLQMRIIDGQIQREWGNP